MGRSARLVVLCGILLLAASLSSGVSFRKEGKAKSAGPKKLLHPPDLIPVGVEGADFDISAENKAKYQDNEQFVFTCTGTEKNSPRQFPSKFLDCCTPVHWLLPRKINADTDSIRDEEYNSEYARSHDASLEWLQNQVLRDPFETYPRECLEALVEAKCLGSFRKCEGDKAEGPCASVCHHVNEKCKNNMDNIIFPAFKNCNDTDFWWQGDEGCTTRKDLGGDAWEIPDHCVAPSDLRHKDIAAFEENRVNGLQGFKPGDDELTEEKALEVVHALENLLVHLFSLSYNAGQEGWSRDSAKDASGIRRDVVLKEDEVYELEETLKEYLSDIDAMMSDPANINIMDLLQTAQSHIAAAISHLDNAAAHRKEFGRHLSNMLMGSKIPRKLPKPMTKLPTTKPKQGLAYSTQEAPTAGVTGSTKGMTGSQPKSPASKDGKAQDAPKPGSSAGSDDPDSNGSGEESTGGADDEGDVRVLGVVDPEDRLNGAPESEGSPNNSENIPGMDRPSSVGSSDEINSEMPAAGSGKPPKNKPSNPEADSKVEMDDGKRRQIVMEVLKAANLERKKCLPVPENDIVQLYLVTKPERVEGNKFSVHMSTGEGTFKVVYEDNDSYLDQMSFNPSPCLLESYEGDGLTEVSPTEPDMKDHAVLALKLFNGARQSCKPPKPAIDSKTVSLEASEVQVVNGRIVDLQMRMTDPSTNAMFVQRLQLWSKPDGAVVLEDALPTICGTGADGDANGGAPASAPTEMDEYNTWDRRFYDSFHGKNAKLPTLNMDESMWTIAQAWEDDEDIPVTVLETIPAEFDVRTADNTKGCFRGPRNQGVCGSCWAFSSVMVLAERYCVQSGGKVDVHLSPQDAIECATEKGINGCCGGQPYLSWKFLSEIGVREERCVPYKAVSQQCQISSTGQLLQNRDCLETFTDKSCVRYKAVGAKSGAVEGQRVKRQGRLANRADYVVRQSSTYTRDLTMDTADWREKEKIIMSAIMRGGSVEGSMVVHPDLFTYKSGVYQTKGSERGGGHMVKIIGWGVENGMKYWTVQNSWGPHWGEGGTFRIRRGVNECRIEDIMRWADPLRTCPNDCTGRGFCESGDTVNDGGKCSCAVGFKGADCSMISLDMMNPANAYWKGLSETDSVTVQYMDNRIGGMKFSTGAAAQIKFCGEKDVNVNGFDLVNRHCGAKVAAGADCSAECRNYLDEHITRIKTCGDNALQFLIVANRAATLLISRCGLGKTIEAQAALLAPAAVSSAAYVTASDRTTSSDTTSSTSSSSSAAGALVPSVSSLVVVAVSVLFAVFAN